MTTMYAWQGSAGEAASQHCQHYYADTDSELVIHVCGATDDGTAAPPVGQQQRQQVTSAHEHAQGSSAAPAPAAPPPIALTVSCANLPE